MRAKQMPALALVVAAAALSLTGCNSSDGSSASASTSASTTASGSTGGTSTGGKGSTSGSSSGSGTGSGTMRPGAVLDVGPQVQDRQPRPQCDRQRSRG